jgi:hypothetical protein
MSYIRRKYISPTLAKLQSLSVPFIDAFKATFRYGLYIALWAGIASVVYTNFIHQNFSALSENFVATLKTYTPIWFAAGYVIQQSLPFLKKTITPDLSVWEVRGDADLVAMQKVIDGADDVEIVSGNFSFIDTNKKLEDCLRTLAFAGKLRLTSYKSASQVDAELNTKSVGREILLKLKDDGKISYDFPVKGAKITMVEHGGSNRMLFRFGKPVGNTTRMFMGNIHGTTNTPQLLKLVHDLIKLNRQHQEAD